jgi:hypothetical protein
MNYPENKDEKIRDIFVKDIVKDKLNVPQAILVSDWLISKKSSPLFKRKITLA